MRIRRSVKVIAFALMFAMLVALAGARPALADTFGDYTYTVTDGEATITDYASGSLNRRPAIPSVLPYGGGTVPVKVIGTSAFWSSGISSVDVPSSVTTIAANAFYDCPLASVTLHEGLRSIGDSAFYWCRSLPRITIPASVMSIGPWAFDGGVVLSKAYFLGNAPAMGAGVFSRDAASFTVYFNEGATGFATPPGPWTISVGHAYPTAYITGDITPPVLSSLVITPSVLYSTKQIELGISAYDASSTISAVQYMYIGMSTAGWTSMTSDGDGTYSATLPVYLQAGDYWVYFRAQDSAGNWSDETVSRHITVYTKPTVSVSLSMETTTGSPVTVNAPTTITGSVSPVASGSVTITLKQMKGRTWRTKINDTAAISELGEFSYTLTPRSKGLWMIEVWYPGGEDSGHIYSASNTYSSEFTVVR